MAATQRQHVEHVGTAVELWQTQQRLTIRGRDVGTGLDQTRHVLGLQQAEQLVFRLFRQAGRLGQCLENADMAQDQCG